MLSSLELEYIIIQRGGARVETVMLRELIENDKSESINIELIAMNFVCDFIVFFIDIYLFLFLNL
jgi:hypothetical protein